MGIIMDGFMVNWVAVIVASLVSFVFGWLWYSPMLFGGTWSKLSGMKMGGDKEGMWMPMVWMFVATLALAYVLSYVLHLMGAMDMMSAFKGGFWVWLGFFAAGGAHNYLFPPKSFSLYALDMVHQLIAILLMAWILVAWK